MSHVTMMFQVIQVGGATVEDLEKPFGLPSDQSLCLCQACHNDSDKKPEIFKNAQSQSTTSIFSSPEPKAHKVSL